jgi:hypothetical protein
MIRLLIVFLLALTLVACTKMHEGSSLAIVNEKPIQFSVKHNTIMGNGYPIEIYIDEKLVDKSVLKEWTKKGGLFEWDYTNEFVYQGDSYVMRKRGGSVFSGTDRYTLYKDNKVIGEVRVGIG